MAPDLSRALARFNAAPLDEAVRILLTCCAAREWAEAVASGRPYRDPEELYTAGERVTLGLSPAGLDEALAGHPRINAPSAGAGPAGARGERPETVADAGVCEAIAEGAMAYERRFGRRFLIRTGGRGAHEILGALRDRLSNDDETEAAVVHDELATINRRRLRDMLARPADETPPGSRPSGTVIGTHVVDTALGRPARGVPVVLESLDGDTWRRVGEARTDGDGRIRGLPPLPSPAPVTCRLVLSVAEYLQIRHGGGFLTRITVEFVVGSEPHVHVPVLLGPFGYSVYRAS